MAPGCSLVKNVLQPAIRRLGPAVAVGFFATGRDACGRGAGVGLGAGVEACPPPPRFNGARETPGEPPAALSPNEIGLSSEPSSKGMGLSMSSLPGGLLLPKLSMYGASKQMCVFF